MAVDKSLFIIIKFLFFPGFVENFPINSMYFSKSFISKKKEIVELYLSGINKLKCLVEIAEGNLNMFLKSMEVVGIEPGVP